MALIAFYSKPLRNARYDKPTLKTEWQKEWEKDLVIEESKEIRVNFRQNKRGGDEGRFFRKIIRTKLKEHSLELSMCQHRVIPDRNWRVLWGNLLDYILVERSRSENYYSVKIIDIDSDGRWRIYYINRVGCYLKVKSK